MSGEVRAGQILLYVRHAGIPKGFPQKGPRIFTASVLTYLKIRII
jgi:hypothetical protein